MFRRTRVEPTELEVGDVIEGPVRVVKIKTDERKTVVTVELARDTVVLPNDTPVWKRD